MFVCLFLNWEKRKNNTVKQTIKIGIKCHMFTFTSGLTKGSLMQLVDCPNICLTFC